MYKLTLLNLYKPIDEKESTLLNYFKFFNFEHYKDCHSFKCETDSFKIIQLNQYVKLIMEILSFTLIKRF